RADARAGRPARGVPAAPLGGPARFARRFRRRRAARPSRTAGEAATSDPAESSERQADAHVPVRTLTSAPRGAGCEAGEGRFAVREAVGRGARPSLIPARSRYSRLWAMELAFNRHPG